MIIPKTIAQTMVFDRLGTGPKRTSKIVMIKTHHHQKLSKTNAKRYKNNPSKTQKRWFCITYTHITKSANTPIPMPNAFKFQKIWWLSFKNHIYIYANENHKTYQNRHRIILFHQNDTKTIDLAYIYIRLPTTTVDFDLTLFL